MAAETAHVTAPGAGWAVNVTGGTGRSWIQGRIIT